MLPPPFMVSDPALVSEMVPVALLVEIAPELVKVPPAMVIRTLEDVLPAGAAAEMVPELVKVPLPIPNVITDEVPLVAEVWIVPAFVKVPPTPVIEMFCPEVVTVPRLLKLPPPAVIDILLLPCNV